MGFDRISVIVKTQEKNIFCASDVWIGETKSKQREKPKLLIVELK